MYLPFDTNSVNHSVLLTGAPVYLAAVMEYLAVEVVELAGNAAVAEN